MLKINSVLFLLAFQIGASTPAIAVEPAKSRPIVIQEQGSFATGGTVIVAPGVFDPLNPTTPSGQTYHGDHATVYYQIPIRARKYPMVMLHGSGQSARSWETTADGREGFQSIFLRRRFAVYLLDEPRRGNASRTTVEATIKPTPDEQFSFDQFRIGVWPDYFAGVQFDRSADTLNQFFRAMVPNIGPFDPAIVSDGVSALFDKIGPAILMTHSQGGGPGWLTAIKNHDVRAVIAFEPGSGFVFPESEVPPPMPSSAGTLEGVAVPLSDFMKLTKIPIIMYYGDNIPEQPTKKPGQDNWRVRLAMARLWRDTVNRHGGDVTLIHLPEIGIKGNTHFAFADLNNIQIADLVSRFLKEKNLD
jgi:pimeloyl-ACP methyl ester carboxylesterase